MKEILSQLDRVGMVVLPNLSTASFEDLAHTLGTARSSRNGQPAFEALRVLGKTEARRHSHSALYGAGGFPFHTDTAHWRIPARYVVLRCDAPSDRPTFVVNVSARLSQASGTLLAESLFTVVDARRSFLAAALEPARSILRYDPSCMRPATRVATRAVAALADLIASSRPERVDWTTGMVLVIDNWRCLHARGVATLSDGSTRQLTRALIESRE